MNITDIDDKIIKRARQNYLYDKYVEKQRNLEEVLSDSKEVMNKFEENMKKTTDPDKKQMMERLLTK